MKYEAPLFEAINLQANDVITTSDTPIVNTQDDSITWIDDLSLPMS